MVKFVGRPGRVQPTAPVRGSQKVKRDPSLRQQIGWDDYNPGSMQPTCRLTALPGAGAGLESWEEKGKMSSRCFWNACKALSFGLLLMFIGTAMAILGYFADQLSEEQELRGNTTVRIKHEARGFHLNNLSYAGPIVMGVGGFIVVAACVMTFEARDSAAKVVPTPRPRLPSQRKAGSCYHRSVVGSIGGGSGPGGGAVGGLGGGGGSRRSTSSQTKWLPAAAAEGSSPELLARRAITASFVQFSRELGARRSLGKSPSAPDLQQVALLEAAARLSPRGSRPPASAGLLNPHVLLQRQALSVDNPDYGGGGVGMMMIGGGGGCFTPPGFRPGSQASMALDLHLENPVTLRVRDRTRRSDTARRHVFMRQRPVEEDERSQHSWSPRYYRGDSQYKSSSTPHSRRESMARSPRPSQEERRSSCGQESTSGQQRVSSGHHHSNPRVRASSRSASERSGGCGGGLTPEDPSGVPGTSSSFRRDSTPRSREESRSGGSTPKREDARSGASTPRLGEDEECLRSLGGGRRRSPLGSPRRESAIVVIECTDHIEEIL